MTGTEDAIRDGWADIVITHSVPKGHLGEPIAEFHFIAVCHHSHPLAQIEEPIDPNELLQHLQIVIKDTSSTPNEKQGWLRAESRWTVSQFQTAVDILNQGLGFCWLPEHWVKNLTCDGDLVKLNIKGSSFRKLTSYLVHPKPDNLGPGSRLLSDLILQNRQLGK